MPAAQRTQLLPAKMPVTYLRADGSSQMGSATTFTSACKPEANVKNSPSGLATKQSMLTNVRITAWPTLRSPTTGAPHTGSSVYRSTLDITMTTPSIDTFNYLRSLALQYFATMWII